MTKEEMQEEIKRLRKQVEDLTNALVDVAMSQKPTYVPYPVAPAPQPVIVPYTPYTPITPTYPYITWTCESNNLASDNYQVINS